MKHNNRIHSDSKKRRSFVALLFAAGDAWRCARINYMNIETLRIKVIKGWQYLRSRDLTFWSVIATFLLVIITFALAIATKQMADVMSKDYMIRTMPIFRMTTPVVTLGNDETKFTFSVANVSQGIAKGTIHHIYLEDHSSNIIAAQNVIVGKGKWAKKLNEIPIDYVPNTTETIKLNWPLSSVDPEKIKNIIIILEFKTLFDEKRHWHIEGFIYEYDHNNLDPMTQDRLSIALKEIANKTGYKAY